MANAMMILESHIDLPKLIFGFGVTLFLSLACLLRIQYRRQVKRQEHLDRGLRAYAATAEAPQEEMVA
jgi:hypothetical protein